MSKWYQPSLRSYENGSQFISRKLDICENLCKCVQGYHNCKSISNEGVSIHWTGLLDWNTGMTPKLESCSFRQSKSRQNLVLYAW